ncbi:S4 domain-containing protein YaaA [Tuberibacillus calidus]|jgi:S4 domain protein YaaA|uniref:S4 domain-containing protein YaaA n=1 Tax=Tuberibacillus calidus TaxID=340097 RepID=UPI000423AEB9|nr:S4 domain-containing protein YaaA [Tuberibacillus calidus]
MQETIHLKNDAEYLTLGQMLKIAGLIATGGQAKWFLLENQVYVNDQLENRRGRKLFAGDEVRIEGCGAYRIAQSS